MMDHMGQYCDQLTCNRGLTQSYFENNFFGASVRLIKNVMFYCDERFIQLAAKHVQMPLVRRLEIRHRRLTETVSE